MKIVLTILTFILFLSTCDILAQRTVYYFRDTGIDTLTLYNQKTFKSKGSIGVASSIESSGDCKISGDTLFLIQKSPTVINQLDTHYHNLNSQDTLLMLDELTLVLINNNNYGLYKLIEKYENNILRQKYSWKYIDRSAENVVIDGKQIKVLRLNKYPIQHGIEAHYYKNGIIEKEYIWENGELMKE